MNTSIVNPSLDNNTASPVIAATHKNKSCESAISETAIEYLHKLCWELKELNIFLDSGINLCESTESQLKEQRMELIERLEFCLSSPSNASQVLSVSQI
ncbi:hypothetical protein I7100_005076 [Vibrio parahaemolyticus]|uniref:hypothetical protein n=1 Tax=Vibrio parahaemolyticus TaxID=670 RepID=UPI00186993A1|nr:hypothetical protein [Vibrio parahaemolyticus]EJE4210524.1 hypothetical protein [Vibrio parahaemolyticus]MBE4305589.1 hypothetical protein [Vibrio parahaemolyticus]MBE4309547.1 hypothetical protein [Vibrio parahaemolyticus]HCG9745596.1 hypothetical protein [Vibrio parahaemolyticus]